MGTRLHKPPSRKIHAEELIIALEKKGGFGPLF